MSAICQYHISDVKKVFDGSFKEYREASQRWGRYAGTVPSPRPGAVRHIRTHDWGRGGQEEECLDQ